MIGLIHPWRPHSSVADHSPKSGLDVSSTAQPINKTFPQKKFASFEVLKTHSSIPTTSRKCVDSKKTSTSHPGQIAAAAAR